MTATFLALLWMVAVTVEATRRRPATPRPMDAAAPPTASAGGSLARRTSRRRAARRREAAVTASVPDVADLFAIAVAAGANVRLAVEAVVRAAPEGPLADELRTVLAEVAAGARLADALARVPDRAGEAVRALVAALVDAERYGSVLDPALTRVADDARRRRQRRAEEAARQVPVKLLFPLVLCVLPAFALLTVAPLVAGGLRSLRP